jgi:hypothetical protein
VAVLSPSLTSLATGADPRNFDDIKVRRLSGLGDRDSQVAAPELDGVRVKLVFD